MAKANTSHDADYDRWGHTPNAIKVEKKKKTKKKTKAKNK